MQPGLLVEIKGNAEEGFPGSYVGAVLLSWQESPEGGHVRYLEFIDDETGQQLEEFIPGDRIRPAPPTAASFERFDQLQVGQTVELYQDDVWWKGLVLRKTPAGVHVYMPEVDHSCTFVKVLRNLRPAYTWVSAAAAAAAVRAPGTPGTRRIKKEGRQQQQQQQQQEVAGHWMLRKMSLEQLQELKLGEADIQYDVPATLPFEPVISELATLQQPAAADTVAGAEDCKLPVAGSQEQQQELEDLGEAGLPDARRDTLPFADVDQWTRDSSDDGLEEQGRKKKRVRREPSEPAAAAAAAAAVETSGQQQHIKQEVRFKVDMAVKVEPKKEEQEEQEEHKQYGCGLSCGHDGAATATAAAAAAAVDGDGSGSNGSGSKDVGEQPQNVAGAAAAAGAGCSAAAVTPAGSRRSARAAKPRVVYVNGLPVLKDNLYGKEGEPSVFQKELAAKPYTEQGYPTAPPVSPAALARQQQLHHKRLQRQQHNQEREARCLSPVKGSRGGGAAAGAWGARMKHNADVKATLQASAGVRAAFLASHLQKLRPFIAPQVADSLERAAAAVPHGALANLPDSPSGQPDQIKAVLRDYQLEGLSWLVQQHHRGLNSILADEMGLGKTLQTIAFLAQLKWGLGVPGPHLVVVPLSVMSSWMTELAKWCPELRAVKLHTADIEERKRIKKEVLAHPDSFDVAVTTYEMVASADFGRPIQSMVRWRYLVLDEGHRIRNSDTITSKALRLVRRAGTLLLTGTPLQNNMVELYGLLSFMYPDIFTTPGPFEAAFNLSKGQVDKGALSAAHYLLRPFCLRRLKTEVEVTLPPKVETRITVPLSKMQIFWYRRLLLRNHEALSALEQAVTGGSATGSANSSTNTTWKRLMNLIIQLRKVVNHPFTMPGSEPEGEGSSSLQQLLDASGKLSVLHRLLGKLKARGHRVVLFSQFTMMLDIMEDYLEQAGHSYVRLDGSMNRVQRMINISQFNKANSNLFIFLASTRAGGLGLNLQSADTVILYDSDWNPQWDLQAMARVHRIGQTKPVHIYRMVTGSSVEERMLQRADSKLYLDQMVNRGSTARAQELDGMSTEELLAMLTFGADRILSSEAGEGPSDADLDVMIDRSREAAAMAAAQEEQQKQQQQQREAAPNAATAAAATPAAAAAADDDVGMAVEAMDVDAASAAEAGAASEAGGSSPTTNEVTTPVATGSGSEKPTSVKEVAAAAAAATSAEAAAAATLAAAATASAAAAARGSAGTAPNSTTSSSKLAAADGSSGAGSSGQEAPAAAAAGACSQALAGGNSHHLMPVQLNAATFQAAAPPPNTFKLNGIDYSAAGLQKLREQAAAEAAAQREQQQQQQPLAVRKLQRSGSSNAEEEGIKAVLSSIGREWQAKQQHDAAAEAAKRQRQQRLVQIDGYQVLRKNNYDWEQGGISAWHETRASVRPENGGEPPKRRLQKAGRDYCHSDTCQVCWDGGELICCDVCPAAFHAECLGQEVTHLAAKKHWACPHHTCASCGRGPAAAGGLLFRCGVCEAAWCEDHLPAEHEILGEWPLFQKALGQEHPSNACFIMCGPDCQQLQQRLQPTIDWTIRHHDEHPELRTREREEYEQDKAGKKKGGKRSRMLAK